LLSGLSSSKDQIGGKGRTRNYSCGVLLRGSRGKEVEKMKKRKMFGSLRNAANRLFEGVG